jgi:predicted permease
MIVGRLGDGVPIQRARAELAAIAGAHVAEEPADMRGYTDVVLTRVTGFPADASGVLRGFVALLFVVSALVLVIASVNVASMLLARAVTRRREMALRLALGVGRGRLVRQLLTESVVLFLGGAVGGLCITIWGTSLFAHVQLPTEVPLAVDMTPAYRVLMFSLGTALVTGVVFGLAPALQATRQDHAIAFRSECAGAGARRSRLRDGLVIGQLALSLLLLMSAGLLLRALARGEQVKPGIDVEHVATAPIDVGSAGYTDDRARVFYDVLADRLRASPGVTAVSYTRWVPLTNSSAGTDIRVDDHAAGLAPRDDGSTNVNFAIVAPGYFDVLRLPLVRGRAFTTADNASAPHVAVVNERFAAVVWPGRDPIGRTFHEGSSEVTVVGVARDARYSSLSEELRPFLYLPAAQRWRSGTNLLVRTTGDAALLTPVIRDAVRAVDPLLPVPDVLPMRAATSVALLPQRVAAAVTGVMGLVGLLLAAVGLYGVVGYSVSQRTHEIGVRMALGANRTSVLRLVIRDGLRLTAIGSVIGVVLALALTGVMTRFLFGVSPVDPVVFAWIPLALGAVALIATYVPARRAASTDPLAALRME